MTLSTFISKYRVSQKKGEIRKLGPKSKKSAIRRSKEAIKIYKKKYFL